MQNSDQVQIAGAHGALKPPGLVSRVCGSVLASFIPKIALVSSYTPSGTVATVSLLESLNRGAVQAASASAEEPAQLAMPGMDAPLGMLLDPSLRAQCAI